MQARKINKWQHKLNTGEAEVPKIKEHVAAPRGETWKQTPSKAAGKNVSKPQDMQMIMQNRFENMPVYEQGSTSLQNYRQMHTEGKGNGPNKAYAANHVEH